MKLVGKVRESSDFLHLTREAGEITEIRKLARRILDNFYGPAFTVNRDGIIEYYNKYVVHLMGRMSKKLLGKEFVSLCLPAESQTEIKNIFTRVWQEESFAVGNVLCKLNTIKAEYLIEWQIVPLLDSSHNLDVVAIIGYNIEDYRHDFGSIGSPFPSTGIFIVQDGKFKFWNANISYYSGCEEAEMIDYEYFKIVHPEDKDLVRKRATSMLKGKSGKPYEYRYITRDGETRWAIEAVVPVVYGGRRAALGYVMDITEEKRMQKELRETENIYRTIFENSGTAMAMFGEDALITMANRELEKLSGYHRSEVENKMTWMDFVHNDDLAKMLDYHRLRTREDGNTPINYEFNLVHKSGAIKNIYATISVIPGTKTRLASLMDVTSRREAEDKLRFLSVHDKLTGLYNRTYFEEKMAAVQAADGVGIIVCDIDGLKLINDTFGHVAGDGALVQVAQILSKCAGEHDVVARTGGDEFAVLLTGAGYADAEKLCSSIRRSVSQYNDHYPEFPLSVSLGFALSDGYKRNPYDLFKMADDNMYREKLLHGQSVRNSIVQLAMKTLGERDFRTEGHAERLRDIVTKMATVYPLINECNLSDMILLAEFHDIGKVGISDSILFKKGPLTDKECAEMQRHCEIGQRIALSSHELAPIADWILKHHERWDGRGYPLGIKGEEIPLACRILAIADSYDAMVSDRPYRKAMSPDRALAEIVRCSGSQFDPSLVEVFVRLFERGLIAPGKDGPVSAPGAGRP